MIKNEDIICISSIDWDFIWQGHQEIMSTFAANGNRVLFIENTGVRPPNLKDLPRLRSRVRNWFKSVRGIRKERENLYIYSPLILPFPYSRIARLVNRRLLVSALRKWIRSVGFSDPIVWTFLPTGIALDIINAIEPKIVIYYCIDNFAASSPAAKKIIRTEDKLLESSDLVFVTAKNLYDRCSRHNKNVHVFPFGVNMETYEKARKGGAALPTDMASVKKPVIGYVGGVHKWIDAGLVKFLAQGHQDKSFVFVGPLQRDVDEFKGFKNVHFLGQKDYAELPAYVSNFDVCLIPYLITEYTKNVYPTKLTEYLSLGKAVVSTALPEIEAFNERNGGVVSVARSREEFSRFIESAVSSGAGASLLEKRMRVAEEEGSWKIKIDKMCSLIEGKIRARELEKSARWKENMLKLYAGTKRKLIPALVGLLALYLALFHTPLLWWAASPLDVEDELKKSDAIVVFAGGVGESGEAGQGYEERVKYAVDLYRKGLAGHIIFSSGYTYVFKEAAVMKALATSLDVPRDMMVVEDEARNTYENVRYTAKIMDEMGWRSAILVSSPYHMRRALMVWKKEDPQVKILAAPIKYSIFFGDRKKVEVKHILAVLHEYLGIAYYKFKGYL